MGQGRRGGRFIADDEQVTSEPMKVVQPHWPLGNASPTPRTCPCTPTRVAKLNSNTTKCRQGCGEAEPLTCGCWEHRMGPPHWKTVGQFLKKLNLQPPCDSARVLLGVFLREAKTCVHTEHCTRAFTAALLQKSPKLGTPRCPPRGICLNSGTATTWDTTPQ